MKRLASALVFCTTVLAQAPKTGALPLLDCDGLLCIDATAGGGQTLRLVLDLGARNAYLDSKAAQKLGIAPAGDSPVQQTTVAGLRLGDLPMGDFPFMVLDTTPDLSAGFKKVKSKPLPADGALTFGAFQNRMLQVDIANKFIHVSEPLKDAVPCPNKCADIVTKHFGRFGPVTLTVVGFELNGQSLDAQIDTLFTGTILIYPAAVERLGIKKLAKSKQKEPFPYAQDGLRLARADGGDLSFRGVALMQNAPVYFWAEKDEAPSATHFDATVGTALLSHGVATFDFKGQHFWIEGPDTDDR
ncbi:MAG TPA: retropepsin-like aspartic protease [Bryobacteraceae bacterium]|nr:retropepsin-like aspartic protease [Bryobacteraceae bacterium]